MNLFNVTLSALCLLGLQPFALAQTQQGQTNTRHALQGVWWERCGDPAAALAITGKRYGGDFVGEHLLTLTQRRGQPPVLTFTKGLPFGHSVHVSGRAESFEVVKSTGKELVLSPMPGASRAGDWTLSACPKLSLPPAPTLRPGEPPAPNASRHTLPPEGAGSLVSPPSSRSSGQAYPSSAAACRTATLTATPTTSARFSCPGTKLTWPRDFLGTPLPTS